MLYKLLAQYIENQLYTSIEEVHEKIVVHHAVGDLTDGEFTMLFNMLFPTLEGVVGEEMTLEIVEDEVKQMNHPMPQSALTILQSMSNANILENEKHKLDMYMQLGQLTEEQYNEFVLSDVPVTFPEIEQPNEEEVVATMVLTEDVEPVVENKKKTRKTRKK